jgi:multisubunit Na+/H+ antiporter MnhG subunit
VPKDRQHFDLYHQLQYDRIDKLETKRENFCNYIITISSGFFVIVFTNTEKLNLTNSLFLFIFIFLINTIAILFICKTRPLIKMHQGRAKLARKRYLKELGRISDLVSKPVSAKDLFRRDLVYCYLHGLIIIFFISLLVALQHTSEVKKSKSSSIIVNEIEYK